MAYTASNVTAGKPKVGGAVSVGPVTATRPTSADGEATGFTSLGHISEDGLSHDGSVSVDQIKAWGGDVVLVTQTEKNDKYKFKLIEYINADVQKLVYGDSNVTGALSTGLSITAKGDELPAKAFVIDMVLTGNVLDRHVIPNGKISSISEVSYTDSDVAGYEIEITALPDSSGVTHYEYMKSPSTQAATPAEESDDTQGSDTNNGDGNNTTTG